MEENNQNQVNKRKNKILAVCLILLICVIGGLVAGIVLINNNNSNTNNGTDGTETDESVLSDSEKTYSALEEYAKTSPDDLRELATKYCDKKIGEASDINVAFDITISCVSFMIENSFFNDATSFLDKVDADDLNTSQLIILYDYYGVAYDDLGDTLKSNEYRTKYQKLMETVKEREQ